MHGTWSNCLAPMCTQSLIATARILLHAHHTRGLRWEASEKKITSYFTTATAASCSSSATTAEAEEPAIKKAKHWHSGFNSLWHDQFSWVRYIKDSARMHIRFFYGPPC